MDKGNKSTIHRNFEGSRLARPPFLTDTINLLKNKVMRTQNQGNARQRQGIKTSTKVTIVNPDGTKEELIPVWEASEEHNKAVDAPTSELE